MRKRTCARLRTADNPTFREGTDSCEGGVGVNLLSSSTPHRFAARSAALALPSAEYDPTSPGKDGEP